MRAGPVPPAGAEPDPPGATPRAADRDFGPGFDPAFLPFPVPAPVPEPRLRPDLREPLHYTHFTVAMSRSRRLARWVAWNIDGATRHDDIPRDDQKFRPDPRLPVQAQTTGRAYRHPRLDRGHLARRADLLWGDRDDALAANYDSFYFTNITPQMDTFNQAVKFGVWGQLENALLKVVDRQRASVLAGPVLATSDPAYADVQVPAEFWKVLVYELGGRSRLRIFLVTQKIELGVLPDPLATFETYAITVKELHERTGLQLSPELAARFAHEPRSAHDVWGNLPILRASSIYW